MKHIRIIDRPCGWGKTRELINNLNKRERYIVVVPLLSETERVQKEAEIKGVTFHRPGFDGDAEVPGAKSLHLQKLLNSHQNVVCTHELIYRLGSAKTLTATGLNASKSVLSGYCLIVDEVLDPFKSHAVVDASSFTCDYLGLGLATIDEHGIVSPTEKWANSVKIGSKTFDRDLYHTAMSRGLIYTSSSLLIETFPIQLLTEPKSVTVLTYCSKGSYFRLFAEKLIRDGMEIQLVIEELGKDDLYLWLRDVASSLHLKSIPAFECINLSHCGQTRFNRLSEREKISKKASNGLMNLATRDPHFSEIDRRNVILTCAKSNWVQEDSVGRPKSQNWSNGSRLFGRFHMNSEGNWETDGVRWLSNTTRGTNLHSHASHAIYLYDQHPNPIILNYLMAGLGTEKRQKFCDAYAVSELVQWLFRTRIRIGGFGLDKSGKIGFRGERQSVVLFLPSQRMRNLFQKFLDSGLDC